jgi:7,8-dihydro-6-hydroxymethylpterin-pyrophosphokinase
MWVWRCDFVRDWSDTVRNGPRTVDLDILLFGSVQWNEPGLESSYPCL